MIKTITLYGKKDKWIKKLQLEKETLLEIVFLNNLKITTI